MCHLIDSVFFFLIIPEILVSRINSINLDLMKHNTVLFLVERKEKRGVDKEKEGREREISLGLSYGIFSIASCYLEVQS